MGNKLDATRIALEKGFTGVSDPTTTLSAITKGMQDVASWKTGIDDAEIKLKTDTAKAYQDAKKLATERMTGNKTVDAAILEALKSTQDRLYDNQRMVQKGMQTPTDNLIFRQNASSSYDILSSYLKDYDANFQQAIKEAQGYIDEKTGEFVKPTAGAFQAAIQRFQTTLGNPNLYEIVSSENGSLNMNLYKTKINTTTNTRELVLDDDGNPIIDPTMSGIGASALLKGKNQKSPRVYMDDSINKALAEDTALSKAFQVMQTATGYIGIVVDDARNNPQVKRLIDTAAISGTTTVEQRLSILADNMPAGMEQITVNPNEVEPLEAQGIDLNEQIKYTYLDPETGETKNGTYNKYVMGTFDPMSTLLMPKETEDAKLAAERIYKTAIYAGLERKITGKDKTTTFRPSDKTEDDKNNLNTYKLIDQVVGQGNRNSLESLVRESEILRDFTIIPKDPKDKESVKQLVFTKIDGTKTAPIPLGGSSLAVDIGKLITSTILGKGAEEYANQSAYKEGSTLLNKGVVEFEGFEKPRQRYQGLGRLAIGKGKDNQITYASQYIKKADEDKMAAQAQVVVDKARANYEDIPNIKVSFDDLSNIGGTDEISITIDGVKYKNKGYTSDNHKWLMENLDRALSGEEIQGTSSSSVDYGNK